MNSQHRLGQHYSNEKKLCLPYKKILLNNKNKIIVDPFVGKGHLIDFYLSMLSFDEQKEKLLNGQVMGFDIDNENIDFIICKYNEKYNIDRKILEKYFQQRDSFLDDRIVDNSFILTNPPYLAKNVCKKNYKEDFSKYYEVKYKQFNDHFEISINLYSQINGIWIVPSNILSSTNMKNTRKKIIFNLEEIYVYEKKMFDDTDISVCTYFINKDIPDTLKKDITFISNGEKKINYLLTENGNLCSEWEYIQNTKNILKITQGFIDTKIQKGNNKCKLLDTSYNIKECFINDDQFKKLSENCLILRTTDTGSKDGKLGLYTISELWGEDKTDCLGLITKISSRVYTQIFFDGMSIEEQMKLKDDFNQEINLLRGKYNSIFLTNYKNSSNEGQRKRISFAQVYNLINYIK